METISCATELHSIDVYQSDESYFPIIYPRFYEKMLIHDVLETTHQPTHKASIN